jgi:hypothetical protein
MRQIITNSNKPSKKAYMHVNVILTFETWNEYGETQEFFDLYLPVSKKEVSAVQFIHNKLFKKIVKQCQRLNRSAGDLIKISTAGNWDLFTEVTGLESLIEEGHNGKWYFGKGRTDIDSWETELMEIFGFGIDADLSYLNDNSTHDQMMEKWLARYTLQQQAQVNATQTNI